MKKMLELSPEEKESIEPILKYYSIRAKRKITLDVLVNDWRIFVDEVKEGYKFSFYEYINDLDTRDFLQKIIDESPHFLKDKLKKILQSYDGNFMNVTKEIAVSIFKNPKRETHWWWFRIPNKLEGELLEDMYERNIIDQKK